MDIRTELLAVADMIGGKLNKSCRTCERTAALREFAESGNDKAHNALERTKCNQCRRGPIGRKYGYEFDFWVVR